ncbi:MAG: rRNA pseudouridine synthase [Clostridia bacterium]|nr:rRNA pseudouridine synthase [Clostridia bacterium]
MDTIKLQKYFTDCGILSRRAAEDAIERGAVRVNGEIATLGTRIAPSRDLVEYEGRILRPSAEEKICILLNKPRGYVTTLSDEKGRRTVADLTADVGRRVYPIGRLDMDSDGLLLLTDDGALANRLTHPKHEIPKIYHVTVKGRVSAEQLLALNSEMTLDGYRLLPVKARLLSYEEKTAGSVLEMRLREGRNRQIRKMCAAVGLTVLRLSRVAIGELKLDKLPSGKWRKLTASELAYLRGEKQHL